MFNPVLWLLENREYLGKIVILSSIIPYLIAKIPLLRIPMLIAGCSLILTLNWRSLKNAITNFVDSNFSMKVLYFWIFVGFIFAFYLIYFLTKDIFPPSLLIGGLYLLIYFIWFNKIHTYVTENQDKIIFKGHTREKKRYLDFEPYLIPIVLTLIVVFIIASLQSLIITRGRSIFSVETLYWSYPIVVLVIHFIIDLLFNEQLHWTPSGGFVEWKDRPYPEKLPDIKNPYSLNRYFTKIRHTKSPPEGILELLEENMSFLVKEAQNIEYLPFQKNFLHCMGNWGNQVRKYVHIMLAIILTSISSYRVLGLIPIYRRTLFYQMLNVIAMSRTMTPEWRELIEYEVITQKDPNHVLDWIVGARYREEYYHNNWMLSWDGIVYMGKEGYYEAVEKIDDQIHLRPQLQTWALDIWNLAIEYANVFVGEKGRQILSIQAGIYDKLVYLSGHKTLEDYSKIESSRKMKLQSPQNRFVSVPIEKPKKNLSEEEKEKIVASYFDGTHSSLNQPSIVELLKLSLLDPLRIDLNVDYRFLFALLAIFGFLINIGLIYIIDSFFLADVAVFIVSLQVLIMFIISINPSNSDINLVEGQGKATTKLKNSVFLQQPLKISNPSLQNGLIYMLYAIILLLFYRLILVS